MPQAPHAGAGTPAPSLRRSIGLWLLVLYGLGVTIGAGIYVLVGAAAARAGPHAPLSFLLAAFVMLFTAASFAELSGRVPQASGEAAYVEAGFGLAWLTRAAGLAILAAAVIASATIALGCAGYARELVPLPVPALVVVIVLAMTLIAAWGVRESVTFAGVLTVVEVLGLVAVIVAGLWRDPAMLSRLAEVLPASGDTEAIAGVVGAGLLAFFAFLGIDDTVNMVEETRDPRRTVPIAIAITLALTTAIYFLVAFVAVQSVPLEDLAAASAPLGLLFERITGLSPLGITLIALTATMNGIIIMVIMAARVIYGMARRGLLPEALGRVSPVTRTPLNATALVAAVVVALALFVPLALLAETTSRIVLAVFVLVNLALLRIKRRRDPAPAGAVTVPAAVPAIGAASCLALLVAPLLVR